MKHLITFFFCASCLFANSQAGLYDSTFNYNDFSAFGNGSGFDSYVGCSVIQADNKVIVGGTFTSLNGVTTNRITRLNTDGSKDLTFLGDGFSDDVSALALQPDGKIIVGGIFTTANGLTARRIARLNPDGTTDPTFVTGSAFNNDVYAVVIQSDGKILVGGSFTSFAGTARNRIARLNTDGSLDTGFNPGSGFNDNVYALAIQADGKVLAGGPFSTFNSLTRNDIVRLTASGTLDNSFSTGDGFDGNVTGIVVQSNGKILVNGDFNYYDASISPNISRLETNGNLDNSFAYNACRFDNLVTHISVLSDGKIMVAGYFSLFDSNTTGNFVRLASNGTFDGSFRLSADAIEYARSFVIQTDGKMVISGSGLQRVTRIETNGDRDLSYNRNFGTNSDVAALALQEDGKILIGGTFSSYNLNYSKKIARLNPDGSFDASFDTGTGFDNYVRVIAIQADGKILAGGFFSSYDGYTINRIIRLNTDGTRDVSFNVGSGFDGSIRTITPQPDGKILVGGNFSTYNGTTVNSLVRLNIDGNIDDSFNVTGPNFASSVLALELQPDGKIVVGGSFTEFNGSPAGRITRLNPDGSSDQNFFTGTGFNNIVYDFALQSNGKIIAAGQFTNYNGTGFARMIRLESDGSPDFTFNIGTGFSGLINSIAVNSEGKIIAGGNFVSFNGTTAKYIIRLDPDGSIDSSFVSGAGFDDQIYALKLQPDGRILAGGQFVNYNGTVQNRVTRLLGDFYLGMNEPADEEPFTVYPNPSDGRFTVQSAISTRLEVCDLTGKPVWKSILPSFSHEILLNQVKNGMYFVSLTDENGQQRTQTVLIRGH